MGTVPGRRGRYWICICCGFNRRLGMRLLDRAHVNVGVLVKVVIKRGRACLGCANDEEIRKPGHSDEPEES